MLQLKTTDQIQEIKDQNKYSLLLVSKDNCQPCKQLKEYLNQIEPDYPKVAFYNIDGTTIRDWCAQQNIRTVPTLFVYDNDYNIVHTQRGFNLSDEQTIKNILNSFNWG